MIDTFHPLNMTKRAASLDDDSYAYSGLPLEDGSTEARVLSERGPEAFPD